MKSMEITAVGIDVSKRKSTVAIRRPGGVIVACPFDISHSSHDFEKLVSILKTTGGDIRVVMEHTSNYWKPIALTLKNAGFYVSVVNAMLIHDFSDNSIRKLKTDRADSLKIANYALTFWNQLPPFNDEDETRLVLKEQSRMYERLASTATSLRNGLIALADQTFPSIDQAFGHAIKNADGHEKWVDFFSIYWHRDCVLRLSIEKFTESYRKWCLRRNYKFRTNTAHKLYALAQDAVPTLPKNNGTKAYADTSKIDAPSAGMYISEVVDLSGLSPVEQEKILTERNIPYDSTITYEKIVVERPAARDSYKGVPYRFQITYGNKPVKNERRSVVSPAAAAVLDRGVNILIGLTKPYIWIPFTASGLTPSQIFIYSDPSQYASTNIYTHLKIRQCEFYKDYSWQPNAFLERATIEDTTVTYALVNPKTKRFTSQTAKKTEYRKATHYDNDSYILEKAYYCFEHNLPSYKENA